MLKAPFIEIVVNPKEGDQLNITNMVSKFTYDESIEKDNLIELNIVSSYVDLLSEVEELEEGAELIYRFGYVGGGQSVTHRAVITDIEHTFDHMNINMLIRGLDKGSVLKKTSSPQVYENVTSTDIAKLIAARHSLKFQVDVTTKVWEKQPQGNMDDLTFLRKLASQEQSGNYITFIKDDTLYFVRRGLNTSSLVTYTYGQGNNDIILFKPTWRESTAEPSGVGSSATGFDPLSGKFNTSTETAESENETITTGDYHLVYSADGEHLANGTDNESFDIEGFVDEQTVNGEGVTDFADSGLTDIIKTGKQFISGATGSDLTDLVSGSKKSGTQKILEATLTLVGNPLLKVNALITMANVTKRYNGNWFVVDCRHTISNSGYLTELTLNRNGSKKAIKGKNTKKADLPNSTVGDKEGVDDAIILLEYDANGNRTADITESNNYVPPQAI